MYGKTLPEIKPPATDEQSGIFDTGAQFYATAATQARYAIHADDQHYYPKWLAPKPTAAKDRVWGFDRLSDEYLQLNYRPYVLQKGVFYLYLGIGDRSLLGRLYQGEHQQPKCDVILGERLPSYGDFFKILTDYRKTLSEKGQQVRGAAVFVYALEGSDQPPKIAEEMPVSANLTLTVLEQVVDPRAVVLATGKLDLDKLLPEQLKYSPRDWLKELVRLRFAEPWVWSGRTHTWRCSTRSSASSCATCKSSSARPSDRSRNRSGISSGRRRPIASLYLGCGAVK